MKKVFELSFGFGKYDNMQLEGTYVLEDTKDNRKDFLEEYNGWEPDFEDELKDFINGKSNELNMSRDAIDWDEVNCMIVEVKSYDEKLLELVEDFKSKLENLQSQFA